MIFLSITTKYDLSPSIKFCIYLVEFPLDSKRRPSSWKRKDYSHIEGEVANLYTFYILKDNVILSSFMYKRKLKIGCSTLEFAEKLIRCIEFNTSNKTTEFLKD